MPPDDDRAEVTLDPNAVLFHRYIQGLAEEADREWCAANGAEYQPLDAGTLGYVANLMAARWGLPGSETWNRRLKL